MGISYHYEIEERGIKLVFPKINIATKFFNRMKDCKKKEMWLVENMDGKEKRTILIRGIYKGNGSDVKTGGYRLYENYDLIYELNQAESKVYLPVTEKIA